MSKHSLVRVGKARRYAAAVGLSAIAWALGSPGVAAADVPDSETSEVQPEPQPEISSLPIEPTENIEIPEPTVPTESDIDGSPVAENSDAAHADPPIDELPRAGEPPEDTNHPVEAFQPAPQTEAVDTEIDNTYGRHALRVDEDEQHEKLDHTGEFDEPAATPTDAAEPPVTAPTDAAEPPPPTESTVDAESTPIEDISSIETTIGPAPDSAVSGTSQPTPIETALVAGTVGATALSARRAGGADDTSTFAVNTAATDPDNRFVDPEDSDWYTAIVGADPPPGVTYSVPDDATGIVAVHNDSDVDIAIIDMYDLDESSQGLVVVAPGQSHTIAAESPFAAFWVQSERRGGVGQTIGRIVIIDSEAGPTVLVTPAGDDRSVFIPLQGSVTPDFAAEDPDNRFLDAGDGESGTNVVLADPEATGVTYSVLDEDHVTIHNDGLDDIAVTRATPGGQPLTFEVLQPGESGTYAAVPGSAMVLSVQAPRAADGSPVVVGSVVRSGIDGSPVSVSPGDGLPAIPLRDVPLPGNHSPAGELVLQPKAPDVRTATYVPDVTDIDGDTLGFAVYQQARRGVVTIGDDNTVTYTPTDPVVLHDGFVTDSFIVEVSDGRGGTALLAANVAYAFTDVDNALPAVTSVGQQDSIGAGTWTVTVTDADNDRVTLGIATQPEYGDVRVTDNEDGTYTVTYSPDLAQAHRTAHQIQFVLRADDGHDGSVDTPISVDVPYYNVDPGASIHLAEGASGHFLDRAVFDVVTVDGDGDEVEVVSVSTSNGGTASLADGVLVYTPKQADENGYYPAGGNYYESYSDTITIVVDDGHGGRTTVTRNVTVADTTSIPWVDEGQGRVLIFAGYSSTDLSSATSRLLHQPTSVVRAREFVSVVGRSDLASGFVSYVDMLSRYERSLEPQQRQDPWNWANFDRPSVPNNAQTTPKHAKKQSQEDQLLDYIDSEYAGDTDDFAGDLASWFLDPAKAPDRILNVASAFEITKDLAGAFEMLQIFNAIAQNDPGGAIYESMDVLANALTLSKSPLAHAIAANITVWKYVFEQASEIDGSYIEETFAYAAANPGVVFDEFNKARVKVGVDLSMALGLQYLELKLPKVEDVPILKNLRELELWP
ncbi:MAG: Ig-like domain-containing protein [Rhodococcus sp. (in: high G+C Gram-positive bacteria)]|nr:Ig-like domain-containing protein [uncultured Rhodococcus sp.]